MILITFFITFLLKINFISCQLPRTPLRTDYNQTLAKSLFLLVIDSYTSSPGKCIPKYFPYFKSYIHVGSYSPVCDKIRNTCSFYLIKNEETKILIIVFSGSNGFSQYLNQALSFCSKRSNFFGLGEANQYFVRAHAMIWKHIKNTLKQTIYNDYKFIITGHSLGGALAALLALRIEIEKIKQNKDIILYTFGEPRVGTLLFASNFDSKIPQSYRIVYGHDIVPHLPACTKVKLKNSRVFKKKSLPCSRQDINGYYHHGTEIWYPGVSKPQYFFHECLGLPRNEDFECSDRLNFTLLKFKKLNRDHSNYFLDVHKLYVKTVRRRASCL